MRKFILISALLLASASASASAHAGPTSDRGLVLAAADTPAATTTTTAPGTDSAQPAAQPLPPAPETDAAKDSAKPQTADAPKPRASKPRSQARRYEGDEAKARRIAAKYGISW
jgi:hypothetical protein